MTLLLTPWTGKLVRGVLQGRRHRFLLDVVLGDGQTAVAHCANPGRMEALVRPGAEIWLSSNSKKGRTLDWTWELIRHEGELIGANSWTANFLVRSLLDRRVLSGLEQYEALFSERKVSKKRRIDFELVGEGSRHLIEVKNGHLAYPDGVAYFPDSLTVRSIDHLRSLTLQLKRGHRASLLVTVQRGDVTGLRPSDLHDPRFARALRTAVKKGLQVRALQFEPTLDGFIYRGELPVDLAPYETDFIRVWHEENKPFGGWLRPKGDPNAPWRRGRRPVTPVTQPTDDV